MKKQILTTAILLGSISAPAMAVEYTGNPDFVSEYLFRGVPQSDGKPAAQGGLDAAFDSGLYATIGNFIQDFDGACLKRRAT